MRHPNRRLLSFVAPADVRRVSVTGRSMLSKDGRFVIRRPINGLAQEGSVPQHTEYVSYLGGQSIDIRRY